jgi:C-terminal processing protease CtpA/Prc
MRRGMMAGLAVLLVLGLATSAWAPMAPDPGFESGVRAGEAASQRQHELELQRRQFEYQRFLQWEQTARMREPSRDRRFNDAVHECARRMNVTAYTWDANGTPRYEWWGDPTVQRFDDCMAGQGYSQRQNAPLGRTGTRVAVVDGAWTITAVKPGGPAERAGIRIGDRILKVGGIATEGMRYEDVVGLLVGVPGSRVLVTVDRSAGAPQDVTVTREVLTDW